MCLNAILGSCCRDKFKKKKKMLHRLEWKVHLPSHPQAITDFSTFFFLLFVCPVTAPRASTSVSACVGVHVNSCLFPGDELRCKGDSWRWAPAACRAVIHYSWFLSCTSLSTGLQQRSRSVRSDHKHIAIPKYHRGIEEFPFPLKRKEQISASPDEARYPG